jgi:hypothetical protein
MTIRPFPRDHVTCPCPCPCHVDRGDAKIRDANCQMPKERIIVKFLCFRESVCLIALLLYWADYIALIWAHSFPQPTAHNIPFHMIRPSFLLIYNNNQPFSFSSFFFQPTISSKTSLLLLQELPTKIFFFDRSKTDPYSSLSSHQHCKFFFSIWNIIFCCKIKIY